MIYYGWGTGPTTFTFGIDVEPGTGYGFYNLVFAAAGKFDDGGGLFYAEEHFYVEVLVIPGDLDEDDDVDLGDFTTFQAALTGDPALSCLAPGGPSDDSIEPRTESAGSVPAAANCMLRPDTRHADRVFTTGVIVVPGNHPFGGAQASVRARVGLLP